MKTTKISAGIITGTAILALALAASAQTGTSTMPTSGTAKNPMVLQIGPAGHVLMRGTIQSVSSGSLTVKSWGGNWTVNLSSDTKIMPGGDISKFSQGDFVGVQGKVSESGVWTIDASRIRDWTLRQTMVKEKKAANEERQDNIQSVREIMKSDTPRNFQGTVSATSASGFSLASGDNNLTVNVAAGVKLLNRNWLPIAMADIQNGDTVRVWGVNASGTIAAQIVRDLSIPRTSTATSTH